MMLPTVEFLKGQAARLVTYMGDKHRVRLKASSALEAVAAMYQHPDWNTCQALAQRGHTPAYSAQATVTRAPARFPLTWTASGLPDLTVSEHDWFRHTLATGGTKATRAAWLQNHYAAHMARNGAGVFLNAFGAGIPADVPKYLTNEGLLLDMRRGSVSPRLNIMSDMSPAEIAAMLVSVLFPSVREPLADFWLQEAIAILTVAVAALQVAGIPTTLPKLVSLFPTHGRPNALYHLPNALAPDSTARTNLENLLRAFSFDDLQAQQKVWRSLYAMVSQGLDDLATAPWAPGLFSDNPAAKGFFSLLSAGKCLAIESPEDSAGLAERAVLYALRSALTRREDLPRAGMTDWVFALGDVDTYLASPLETMTALARSWRTAILMTTENTAKLRASPVGESMLANTWHQLTLGSLDAAAIAAIVEALQADATMLTTPNSCVVSLPSLRQF